MPRITATAICIFLGVFSAGADAAQKSIAWTYAVCDWTLRFDPKVTDEKMLRDTIDLVFSEETERSVPYISFLNSAAAVQAEDVDRFEKQCEAGLAAFERLRPLDLPGIADYQTERAAALRERCQFDALHLRAAKGDPAKLWEYKPGAAACARYIDALEGRASLEDTWQQMIFERCRSNTDPKACTQAAENERKSDKSVAYLGLYVLNFGWSKCANQYRREVANQPLQEKIIAQFKRRFPIRKGDCDNVD